MNNEKEKTYISTNLKYLRNIKQKSLNDIARICDKTDVAVHYWENGTREPSAVDIAKLSNYFNITVDDFISKDLTKDNDSILNSTEYDIFLQKIKDLSPEKQKIIINVADSIIKEIDKEVDGE